MSDLLLSLVESIAGAVASARERQAAQAQGAAPRPPPSAAPPAPARAVPMGRVAPTAAPAAAPRPSAPALAPEGAPGRPLDVGAMFATSDRLVQTVVASEILGPPLAMRRQNLWDAPGV